MNLVGDPRDGQELIICDQPRGSDLRAGDPRAASWEERIAKLGSLQDGWNGYQAPKPTEKAILTAKRFIDALLHEEYEPNRLAPSAVGGVAITRRQGNKKVYVEFYNDGRILALFSDDVSEPLIERVEPSGESFTQLIAEMRDYLDDGIARRDDAAGETKG